MENAAGASSNNDPRGRGSENDTLGEDEPKSVLQEMEDVLSNFREMWQRELRSTPNSNENGGGTGEVESEPDDYEMKAKTLYLRGAEMEKMGKLNEAIQWYRRAVQMVPDIDFKVQQKFSNFNADEASDGESDIDDHTSDELSNNSDEDDECNKDQPLLIRIQKKMSRSQLLCLPQYPQRTTHISELPMEILLYILKWVISSELDLRSLELCSGISRGFYLCARDQELWRLACMRIWGANCGNLTIMYPTWRDMFINRPQLLFNGCYISKTTYIRHGENNFQDQLYRPWHLVAYYRYLRFFPDGLVLMLTTPDEPSQCIGLLRSRIAKEQTILTGHYRLKDDKVNIVVQHQETISKPPPAYRRGRRRNEILFDRGEQSFHLELRIQNVKKYKHVQLEWTQYSIFTTYRNGKESQSTFEIANNRFPPLWFSRVKSYIQESQSPLQ